MHAGLSRDRVAGSSICSRYALHEVDIRGEFRNFTGIDSPYERPEKPELILDTAVESAEHLADRIVPFLRQRGVLD